MNNTLLKSLSIPLDIIERLNLPDDFFFFNLNLFYRRDGNLENLSATIQCINSTLLHERREALLATVLPTIKGATRQLRVGPL